MADSRGGMRQLQWLVSRLRRADRLQIAALLSVLAIVVGTWAFIALADEITEQGPHAIDVRILQALREPSDLGALRGPAWIEYAARDFTALGGIPVLATFTVFVVMYLWLRGMRIYALLAAGAVSGGALLFTLFKATFGRARPTVVPMLVEETARSFPSGHATLSAIVYLSLAVTLARFESRTKLRGYLLGIGLLVTGIVGATRVLLGVHYPTDVLAGWSLGLAWAALCWLVVVWLERRARHGDPQTNSSVVPDLPVVDDPGDEQDTTGR